MRSSTSLRRFLIVWFGQLLSGVGTGMSGFAFGVYVFRETGTATGFAMVLLCLFMPSILLKPVGGVLADRYDRRRMIVIGDLGAAAGVLFVLKLLSDQPAVLWPIYVGVAVSSAFSALQNPAYKAAITDLLRPDQFSRAGGLVQLAGSAQHLLAPAAAGVLMSVATIGVVLVIDAATFGVAVLSVVGVGRLGANAATEPTAVSTGAHRFAGELHDGWRAIGADRLVLQVVLVFSSVTLFVGLLQTLFGPMVLTFTDARTLGTVQSVSALGMVASSLILGVVTVRRRHREMMLLGLAIAGVSLSLVGSTTRIVPLTAAFFLFFAALPLVNIGAEVLIRTGVANGRQGRAWGIIGFVTQVGYLIAYVTAGVLADRVFEPLLAESGALATSVGLVVGVGPGRGMGFILVLAGTSLAALAAVVASNQRPTVGRSAGDSPTRFGTPAHAQEVIR